MISTNLPYLLSVPLFNTFDQYQQFSSIGSTLSANFTAETNLCLSYNDAIQSNERYPNEIEVLRLLSSDDFVVSGKTLSYSFIEYWRRLFAVSNEYVRENVNHFAIFSEFGDSTARLYNQLTLQWDTSTIPVVNTIGNNGDAYAYGDLVTFRGTNIYETQFKISPELFSMGNVAQAVVTNIHYRNLDCLQSPATQSQEKSATISFSSPTSETSHGDNLVTDISNYSRMLDISDNCLSTYSGQYGNLLSHIFDKNEYTPQDYTNENRSLTHDGHILMNISPESSVVVDIFGDPIKSINLKPATNSYRLG